MILVDTNILVRVADPISTDCKATRLALKLLRGGGNLPVIARQSVYEFWAVATRPAGRPPMGSNGLGMSANRADQWLDYILRTLTIIDDPKDLMERWRNLVRNYNVTGMKSHDARLVAIMQGYGIADILTFNTADFKRFNGINLIDPRSVK